MENRIKPKLTAIQQPKDHDEIVARARMAGARTGHVITLNDGDRFKLSGRTLIPLDWKGKNASSISIDT